MAELLHTKSFDIAAQAQGNPAADKVAILMPGRLDTKDYVNFVSHLGYLAQRGFYAVAIDPPGTVLVALNYTRQLPTSRLSMN